MRVPCPQCQTVFNLPDNAATPGRKLRCAVCQNVFPLEASSDAGLTVKEYTSEYSGSSKKFTLNPKVKKILKILSAVFGVFILLFTIVFATLTFTSLLDSQKELIASFLPDSVSSIFLEKALDVDDILEGEIVEVSTQPVDRIGLLELRDMRQYIVNNEKVGKIAVVEGTVYNGFDKARGSINLEASLYDSDKKLLFSKSQLAGTSVSLFQLQVLPQEELEASLTDSESVLLNNSAVGPGASVPFMILFHAPPESANEFGVRVTSADIINATVFPDLPKPEIPAPVQPVAPAPVQNAPQPAPVQPVAPTQPPAESQGMSMEGLLNNPSATPIPKPSIPAAPVPPAQEAVIQPNAVVAPPATSSMEDLLKQN